MFPHDETRKAANDLVPKAFVESTGCGVERRHADEHVGAFLEYPFLRPADEGGAQAAVAEVAPNANRLDVAGQRTAEIEQNEACDVVTGQYDVQFFASVLQSAQR